MKKKSKIIDFISKFIVKLTIEPLSWFFFSYPGKRKCRLIFKFIFWDILLLFFKHSMTNQFLQQSTAIIGLQLIYEIELVFFFVLFWRLIWYFLLNPLDFVYGKISKLTKKAKDWIQKNPNIRYTIYRFIAFDNTDIIEEINNYIVKNPDNLDKKNIHLPHLLREILLSVDINKKWLLEKISNIFNRLKKHGLNLTIKASFIYYCTIFIFTLIWWFTWLKMILGNISLNQSFELLFSSIPMCGNLWEILSYLAKLQLLIALPVSISVGIVIMVNRSELEISYIEEFINWLKTPPQLDLLGSLMDELKNSTTGK